MSVPILSCECGLRMKAKGATPGRVGRCPECGRTLVVPEESGPKVPPEAGPIERGYGLTPTYRPSAVKASEKRPRRPVAEPKAATATATAEPSRSVEPWWLPDLLFPLRGAEGLMIVLMLGLAGWVAGTLIPELCLGFVADASKMDATPMGWLVSLIAGLPALALGLFAVAYALQYLGRVVISAAIGEVVPPRPPDRNFDGLSEGLGPWLVWLACGASVGLGPLAIYMALRGEGGANGLVVGLLLVVGLPYALMSLLMTLMHDGGWPRPGGVVAALARFPVGFLGVVAVEAVLGGVVVGAFAALLALRERSFWAYLPLMLPCWCLAQWSAIVGMRALGVFYHHHAATLRWHREKPWWCVTPGG